MTETCFDIVIVGAGHGGAQAAIALRQRKFEGSIAIIGEEPELPYERPPLSKEYLSREKAFERILIRPESFWNERGIVVLTGKRVVSVDPGPHRILTENGDEISYGQLIWAAGGHPRKLTCPGRDLAGVHAVRSRADVDRLIGELDSATRVAVIGGGYIGLEAAAVLAKFGKQVTVLEALDRVLARVAGEPLSRFYEQEHRAHGVDIRLGVTVDCIEARGGRATGVRLGDGRVVDAELVIVGIGIVPAIGPLQAAGAACGNGVEVDGHCRTSLPHIFAIGDCAAHTNVHANNAVIRLESVQNANDMASTVARTIVQGGEAPALDAIPWFWSKQYDLKLQTVGLSLGYDAIVMRGDPASRSFSLIYLRAGRVIALDCVNSVKDYVQGRALVANRASPDVALLANIDCHLKDVH